MFKKKQTKAPEEKTEFAKRNPMLERLVPDAIENAVDAILPDKLEKVLDRGCEAAVKRYLTFKTDFEEGVGEVAGVLFRVAKYAAEKLNFGDVVFGVYHLASHHATVNAMDAVEGKEVLDQALIAYLIEAVDASNAAYIPNRDELCKALKLAPEEVLLFEPQTTPARPAYAVWVDKDNKRVVWGFRGTTDLNDMLTDACASCEPYCGGYAHWGMHEAASWFVNNVLAQVIKMVQDRPGYELLLVGHSLGAGTAAMLAHMMKNEPKAKQLTGDTAFRAVGVATPAVLTEKLAEGCSDYVTSVVLMHDLVPRFSIHNVFKLKEEMDDTDWGTILISTAKDWAVPDVIENSETYKRLTAHTQKQMAGVGRMAADTYLYLQSWVVSGLHFAGLVRPNPATQGQPRTATAGDAAAATAATAREALRDPSVLASAMANVEAQMAKVKKDDVHEVFAPGRIYFIKRHDAHKGRARYGNTVHRCRLCADDDALPQPTAAAAASCDDTAAGRDQQQQQEQQAGAAAAGEASPEYSLIAADGKERFRRIVLRESCLLDHLTGGYAQGLRFALNKSMSKGRQQQQQQQAAA